MKLLLITPSRNIILWGVGHIWVSERSKRFFVCFLFGWLVVVFHLFIVALRHHDRCFFVVFMPCYVDGTITISQRKKLRLRKIKHLFYQVPYLAGGRAGIWYQTCFTPKLRSLVPH